MDASVRFGKPCIVGTRVDVGTVVADLVAGESFETVQDDYQLTREQILAALRYAAHPTGQIVGWEIRPSTRLPEARGR